MEVLLGGRPVRLCLVRDYDMISKIRARLCLRNRRGYNRYSGTDGVGRSARPASGLPKNRPGPVKIAANAPIIDH